MPVDSDGFDFAVSDLLHLPGSDEARRSLLSLVGVPFDTTTMARRGAKEAPGAIRRALAGLLSFHAGFGIDLADSGGMVDYGDVDAVGTSVVETWERIRAVVAELSRHDRPLAVLGGDHGLTYPTLQGLVDAEDRSIALISLDAHYDVRPDHHGQPASGVSFRYALEKLKGNVLPEASTQIGIAGWENSPRGEAYLKERGVLTYSSREVGREGVEAVAAKALERAANADGLWLTLDIDVADAAFAPGTNAPTIGGLTSGELLEFTFCLASCPRLRGLDIVEVSPPLDVGGITTLLASQVLLTALAARHRGGRGPH